MTISTKCPHCSAAFHVRDGLEGRTVKCAQCRTDFTIAARVKNLPPVAPHPPQPRSAPPAQAPSAPQPPAPPVKKHPNPLVATGGMARLCPSLSCLEEYESYRKSILTPLLKPLPIIETSAGYKLGLALVALFLVLLPLVYVGAIIGLIAAEYLYFAWTFESFKQSLGQGNGKGDLYTMVFYFAIPVAIGMVILVLLKPLVFGWGGKDNRFEITRAREPLLFELIDHICHFVGAPIPKRVFINCEVNAGAAMSYGIRGAIFGGNDCDLVIGLPLVAGMSTSEFAGVLVHEFGHFTQGGTLRMTYIVHTLLGWFAHIYYYRDRMDVWLVIGSKTGHITNVAFCLLVRGIIWIARRTIWCLMMLGNLAAGFMSRQMEFDADAFEIQLGGSERFATSSRKMITLSVANDKTVNDLQYMLTEERLADNYPLLIAVNSRILDDELQRISAKIIKEEKASLFATHPCTRDRIEAARSMNVPGVLHVDLPASLLFRNFLALSREVSLHFYREVIELKLEPGMLKNAGAVIDQFQREDLSFKAITNFFQRSFPSGWFLPLEDIGVSANARDMMFRLQDARNRQAGFAVAAYHAVREYEKAGTKLSQAIFFRELVRIGAKADFSDVDFRFRTLGEGNRTVATFSATLAAHAACLSSRDMAAAERLVVAVKLLAFPEGRSRIEGGEELHRRMETLLPILTKIAAAQNDIAEVDQRLTFASAGLGMLQNMKTDKVQALWESILSDNDLYRRFLQQFRNAFEGVPYPFEHGKGATLGEFLVPSFSQMPSEPLEYCQGAMQLMGRLHTTYRLALGEVAAVALAVEDVLGMPRLPVPPPDEE